MLFFCAVICQLSAKRLKYPPCVVSVAMSATNPRPTCNRHENNADLPTCDRDTHVRAHPRSDAPTTAGARAEHDRTQAIAGVLSGDWGATTGREVTPAAPTLEVVCPIHGIVHKEY